MSSGTSLVAYFKSHYWINKLWKKKTTQIRSNPPQNSVIIDELQNLTKKRKSCKSIKSGGAVETEVKLCSFAFQHSSLQFRSFTLHSLSCSENSAVNQHLSPQRGVDRRRKHSLLLEKEASEIYHTELSQGKRRDGSRTEGKERVDGAKIIIKKDAVPP